MKLKWAVFILALAATVLAAWVVAGEYPGSFRPRREIPYALADFFDKAADLMHGRAAPAYPSLYPAPVIRPLWESARCMVPFCVAVALTAWGVVLFRRSRGGRDGGVVAQGVMMAALIFCAWLMFSYPVFARRWYYEHSTVVIPSLYQMPAPTHVVANPAGATATP